MDLTYQYTKKRLNCGRQPMFCERGPDICESITTNTAMHKEFILRNPVHQNIQNTPSFSQHEINTIIFESAKAGLNHTEGGWPKDVPVTDVEATQRYRRKIEKEDIYISCVMNNAPEMQRYIMQNNAIDMYSTYNKEFDPLPVPENSSCRIVNTYRDRDARPVSSVAWQPDGGQRFAVSYVEMDSNLVPRGPVVGYVWDLETSNEPEMTLRPMCAMLDLQFCPRDSNLLVGALFNGQVTAWDRRIGGDPTGTSQPHAAHRDLVRKVLFINSKSGQEFFSSGPDGVCKWWDLRFFTEPVDEMIMDVVKSAFDTQSRMTANGVSVLEYESSIPTRFMVGTENGLVISGNRKGKTALEKLPAVIEAHLGSVRSLERNPCFLKNFLTVGDWTARIWSEECRESAVIWTAPQRHRINAGTWSPTRLSLIELVGSDGSLSLWDFLRRHHEPILTQQICTEPLLQLRAHATGNLIALGSKKGCIFMVELSPNLAQCDKNDKSLFQSILDRESKREKILESRLREIKLKQRQTEEGEGEVVDNQDDPSIGDKDIIDATTDYNLQVKKDLASF